MRIKINFWSFIFSLICLVFFLIATTSSKVANFITNITHMKPLYSVLILCILTLISSIIGCTAIGSTTENNKYLLIRSIVAIFITVFLIVIITVIIGLARWIPFT